MRSRLAALVAAHQQGLGCLLPPDTEALRRLSEGAPIVEIGHTPQVFHLGLIRVFSLAAARARETGSVLLLALNDQVQAGSAWAVSRLEYPVAGHLPRHPIRLGPSRRDGRVALLRVPPPTARQILTARERIEQGLGRNLAHSRALGMGNLPSLARLLARVSEELGLLDQAARRTRSYAEWAAVVLRQQFARLHPDTGLVILFTSCWQHGLPELFALLLSERELFTAVKNEAASRGSFNRVPAAHFPGWVVCPADGVICERPQVESRAEGQVLVARCPRCRQTLAGTPDRLTLVPDVVGRQALSAWLGPLVRVHGPRKPYQEVSDEAVRRLGQPVPERHWVTGPVRYDGIGSPAAGEPHAQLVRALFDLEPGRLAEQLLAAAPDQACWVRCSDRPAPPREREATA